MLKAISNATEQKKRETVLRFQHRGGVLADLVRAAPAGRLQSRFWLKPGC